MCFRNGAVAQSVEQRTENPCVGGSIPPHTTQQIAPNAIQQSVWGFLFAANFNFADGFALCFINAIFVSRLSPFVCSAMYCRIKGVTFLPLMFFSFAAFNAFWICNSISSVAISCSAGTGLAINTEPVNPNFHLVSSNKAISAVVSNRKGEVNPLLRE